MTHAVDERGGNEFEEVVGPWNDYLARIDKPREFQAQLTCLTKIGIEDFDRKGGYEKLAFSMTGPLEEFRKDWRTLDMEVIEYLIRICIVRELQSIEERKEAQKARKRMDERLNREIEQDEAANLSHVKSSVYGAQSSPSRAGSPSPGRAPHSPAMKAGGRDFANTGLALRSMAGSSDGKHNRSLHFTEPVVKSGGLTRSAAKPQLHGVKAAPTAGNLA